MIVETVLLAFGIVRAPVSPVRFGTHPIVYAAAPAQGEHTRQVCADLLGYDATTYRRTDQGGRLRIPAPGSRRGGQHDQ